MPIQDILSPIQFGGGYVKRLSATMGLNSTPSTVDIDLIIDSDGQVGPSQTFNSGNLNPGNISGISINNFKFFGIVQSWQKSYGTAGTVHSVKLTDPRLIFSDIFLITNGKTVNLPTDSNFGIGSGIPNLINVYNYYGNDASAEYNEHGMTWSKIKNVLTSTGFIQLYDKRFALSFDSGFDAPSYYRVNADDISLDACIENVARSLGIDYFVEIANNYNPASGFNFINVRSIKRTIANSGTSIHDFIMAKQQSGILSSYVEGKELRIGPTDVIVIGSNIKSINTATIGYPCWGRTGEGRLLTGAGNSTTFSASFEPLDDPDRHNGYVILENINTSNPGLLVGLPTISPEGRTNFIGSSTYPIYNQYGVLNNNIIGYRPTENVMRAAMFSRESWEAILYTEQQSIATALGIVGLSVRTSNEMAQFITNDGGNTGIKVRSYKIGKDAYRTPEQESLIELFYEATKATADTFYGRTFLVELPPGEISVGTSSSGATINFRYGYKVVDAAWYENASTKLKQSSNLNFRDQNGLHKAHATILNVRDAQVPSTILINTNGNLIGSTGILKFDMSNYDVDNYLVDGTSMHLAGSVEQDSTNLGRAIFTLNQPIEFKSYINLDNVAGLGTGIPGSYVEFWRAMGLIDSQIKSFGPIYKYNPELGLAPQRLTYINFFQIPLENQLRQYGPFLATSSRHGGTNLIRDDSLAPWTYGGITSMNAAGQDIANMALADRTVVDLAQFTLVGLPDHNLGEAIGENSNITSLSFSLGIEGGLTTNYSLQTFVSPFVRISKILNEKIYKNTILSSKTRKDVINLDDKIKSVRDVVGNYKIEPYKFTPQQRRDGTIDLQPTTIAVAFIDKGTA